MILRSVAIRPSLQYARVSRSARSKWGIAAVVRSAIVLLVIVHMFFSVYAWIPRDEIHICFVWPPTLAIAIFGVAYGLRGMRVDQRPKLALIGLVANLVFGTIALAGTLESADILYRAWRFGGGVVISSNR